MIEIEMIEIPNVFQSLIGFKINWNSYCDLELLFCSFQSLIGFKINWNFFSLIPYRTLVSVSIPNRV